MRRNEMEILRVINNSNVCVLDEYGKEQIVSGKGIGFKKKAGDTVCKEDIQKTYLVTDSDMQRRMIQILQEIPEVYIKFTDSLVEYIRERLDRKLNESLVITLAAHICFSIKRKRNGVDMINPLLDTFKRCYPKELELGNYCLEQIEKKFHISFIPDEAGFIAMHIINARCDNDFNEKYKITKLIGGCIKITETRFPNINKCTDSYEYFTDYLKYIAKRIYSGKDITSVFTHNKDLIKSVNNNHSLEYKCSEDIRKYILETTGYDIMSEGTALMTVHIARITAEADGSQGENQTFTA